MALVERFAQKVGIHHVYKGRRDKDQALREFAAAEQLELAQICFMGDDVTDLPAMRLAGLSAAPANAQPVRPEGGLDGHEAERRAGCRP